MPKRAGRIFVIIGAVLMLSALLLLIYNQQEDERAGQEAELLIGDIKVQIEQNTESLTKVTEGLEDTEGEPEEEIPEALPVVEIDGYGYIGYLSILDLELELPVMSEWDYDRLKIAPCRQYGSSRTDDLVLAAHNYRSHFGELSELEPGAEILFTDMEGTVNSYQLAKLETLEPDEVNAVLNSEYDLVLYTCTPGGTTRVVAFCDRIDTAQMEEKSNGSV